MRNLYIYAVIKDGDEHSDLTIAERPESDTANRRLFATFESPMMEEARDSVLSLIHWGQPRTDGFLPDASHYPARVLCSKVLHAFMHLVNIPFTCRCGIDRKFADDGGGNVYRHGMRSMVMTYSPSPDPYSATSA